MLSAWFDHSVLKLLPFIQVASTQCFSATQRLTTYLFSLPIALLLTRLISDTERRDRYMALWELATLSAIFYEAANPDLHETELQKMCFFSAAACWSVIHCSLHKEHYRALHLEQPRTRF